MTKSKSSPKKAATRKAATAPKPEPKPKQLVKLEKAAASGPGSLAFSYNPKTDVIVVEGVAYHGDVFRHLAFPPDDCLFRIKTEEVGFIKGAEKLVSMTVIPESKVKDVLDESIRSLKIALKYRRL